MKQLSWVTGRPTRFILVTVLLQANSILFLCNEMKGLPQSPHPWHRIAHISIPPPTAVAATTTTTTKHQGLQPHCALLRLYKIQSQYCTPKKSIFSKTRQTPSPVTQTEGKRKWGVFLLALELWGSVFKCISHTLSAIKWAELAFQLHSSREEERKATSSLFFFCSYSNLMAMQVQETVMMTFFVIWKSSSWNGDGVWSDAWPWPFLFFSPKWHIPAEAGSGVEQKERCPQTCQWCQPCHQANGSYRWHLLSVSWVLTEGEAEERLRWGLRMGVGVDRPSGATPCSPPPVSQPIWQCQALPSGCHQVEAGFRKSPLLLVQVCLERSTRFRCHPTPPRSALAFIYNVKGKNRLSHDFKKASVFT